MELSRRPRLLDKCVRPLRHGAIERRGSLTGRGVVRAEGSARAPCEVGRSVPAKSPWRWPDADAAGWRQDRRRRRARAGRHTRPCRGPELCCFFCRGAIRAVDRGIANGPFWAVTDGGLAIGGSVPARAETG